jgi:hypothetical protein
VFNRERATAFHDRFFAYGETALTPLPARATAFHECFFACGKTALTPLPALIPSYAIVIPAAWPPNPIANG